jgi:hypothetical protein
MPGQPKAKASWTGRLRERRRLRKAKKAERLHATRGAGDPDKLRRDTDGRGGTPGI